jgi:hypothetical protein
VEILGALAKTAEDRDRLLHHRLGDQNGLKPPPSAASFSIRFRYSSTVVAPMQWARRASAGFRRLDASSAPLGGAGADQGVRSSS